MSEQSVVVLDEDDIRRTLVRIAHEVVEKNSGRPVALVGIHRRGSHLATRLHQLVCDLLETDVPLGDIDIASRRSGRTRAATIGSSGDKPRSARHPFTTRMDDVRPLAAS